MQRPMVSDGRRQLASLLADLIDLPSVLEIVAAKAPAELVEMPPFPYPRELFPPDTFPPGMRFSHSGLAELPPSMREIANKILEEVTAAPPAATLCTMPAAGRARRSVWRRLSWRAFWARRRAVSTTAIDI